MSRARPLPDWQYGDVLKHPNMDYWIMFIRRLKDHDFEALILRDEVDSWPKQTGVVSTHGGESSDRLESRWRLVK